MVQLVGNAISGNMCTAMGIAAIWEGEPREDGGEKV